MESNRSESVQQSPMAYLLKFLEKMKLFLPLIQLGILITLIFMCFKLGKIFRSIDFYSVESELSELNKKTDNLIWLECKKSNESPYFCRN